MSHMGPEQSQCLLHRWDWPGCRVKEGSDRGGFKVLSDLEMAEGRERTLKAGLRGVEKGAGNCNNLTNQGL